MREGLQCRRAGLMGWRPRIGFDELVREMMESDLALARRDALIVGAGYSAHSPQD